MSFLLRLIIVIVVIWITFALIISPPIKRGMMLGEEVGTLSHDGRYKLIRLNDDNKKVSTFCILDEEDAGSVEILFSSPYWYSTGGIFRFSVMWANQCYDIFSLSNDSGLTFYKYRDGRWEEWSFAERGTREQYEIVNRKTSEHGAYDLKFIPEAVLTYLSKSDKASEGSEDMVFDS